MSSVILVDGRDIQRDRALLKETKRKVKEALALRTAALVEKYRSKETNTVVDLYPGSDPWELHSRSGALTFVRGATEILTATESPAGSNKWVLTYEAPEARFTESSSVSPRDDRAIPEPPNNICPD
jgi:hypothetical protein